MPEKCNVPAEELPALLAQFPNCLMPDEEQAVIRMFDQYLFYHRTGRRRRLYLCTSCGDCWTDDAGAAHPGHNALWHCPRCGARVTMKAAGKLTGGWGYPSLFEQHNLVVLRASDDGGLLVSGGRVTVSYAPGELHGWPEADSDYIFPVPTIHYSERRRYYMSKGRLASWKWEMDYDGCQAVGGRWLPAVSAGEPIPVGTYCCPQTDDGYYIVLGWDALEWTELRYSAVTEYFDTDHALHHGVVSYLARYARRPQIEMLVKMGYMDIIDRLVMGDSLSGRWVNWRAKTPAAFFRLSKPVFQAWQRSGGHLAVLELLQTGELDVKDLRLEGQLVSMPKETIRRLITQAKEVDIPLAKVLSYVRDARRAQLWIDYVHMGRQLGLDLSRQDVLMPKDLPGRHDTAAMQIKLAGDEEAKKNYARLKVGLERKYAMAAYGMMIRVPASGEEIIAEGRTLHHCVGGYADRHIRGRCTILFLRSEAAPDEPLVTIEMNGEMIVQIHGEGNDFGRQSPRVIYKKFIDLWQDWLLDGSPRDGQGRPILRRETKEVKTA